MKDRLDWIERHLWASKNILSFTGSGPVCLLTNKYYRYFSWQLDQFAEATDAFLQDWTTRKGFANPPWKLIFCVLMKSQTQGAEVILVGSEWKTQLHVWYALLLSVLVNCPCFLPKKSTRTYTKSISLNPHLLSISERDSAVKAFQAKLKNLSLKSWRTKTNKSYDWLFGW